MNKRYRQQLEMLIKIIPSVMDIDNFVIHGGTAINLYVLDLPRYSVDIDITYALIKSREESFIEIDQSLILLTSKIKQIIPNVIVTQKPHKLYCSKNGVMVKIEVSGTKRGLIEPYEVKSLCQKAQDEFETSNKAKIVSFSQLYGGKIAAALDRQHPRDLFDVKLMFGIISSFDEIKNGFLYSLLGSERPIFELLSPNRIDHRETLIRQFEGMTTIPFSYNDYLETREKIIHFTLLNLTLSDRDFLLAFEKGIDLIEYDNYRHYLNYPSVQWKMQNIKILKSKNPLKHKQNIKKLEDLFS
jgi:hypothetical protein